MTAGHAQPFSSTAPRVLIVAEHASARFGGEAILPLHYFRVLRARGIDARLVVHARTRDELAARFPDDWDRMYFVPDTRLHLLLDRAGRWLPSAVRHFTVGWLSRLLSQYMARRIARRLVQRHAIDVVHQPIPVSPRETSVLHGLGAPLVIGPMNGGMTYPAGFGHSKGGGGTAFTRWGRRAAELLNRLFPGKRRAAMLLVANERTRRALPSGVGGRVIELVENGVDLSLWVPPARDTANERTRFVFSGRLVDWKAVHLLIDAFAQVVRHAPATLDIVGDGPERAALEAQARAAGLGDAVRFRGWQPQVECAGIIGAADVFVLPSIYECGGAVVLEAMALGLPVIATAWGGPADYLDDTCGILVPPQSPSQLVAGLADAMLRLARDPDLRRAMGNAGRQRVLAHFDWERKVDRMLEVYAEARLIHARSSPAPRSGTIWL